MRQWALVFWLALTSAAMAIGPEEVLDDPELQARSIGLYDALRCVRCRSETIASSNADWAQDARAVVRERLLLGESDREVMAFFQARYGDYVLMNPPLKLANLALWLAGPALFLLGGTVLLVRLRTKSGAPEPTPAPLSPEERARLEALAEDQA